MSAMPWGNSGYAAELGDVRPYALHDAPGCGDEKENDVRAAVGEHVFPCDHPHDWAFGHAPDSLRHRRFGDAQPSDDVLVGDPRVRPQNLDDVAVRRQ